MTSIIIPLRKDVGYLKECVDSCLKQGDGNSIEVIILPDARMEPFSWNDPRILQEPTGPVSPARKRNRGAQLAKGEILAFMDDDTRACPGWLKAALIHFNDPQIGAVGGPSVTPPEDPFWAQISGAAYESWMLSAAESRRYWPGKACDVHDFPSCNLLVRRSAFDAVSGFRTDFWPGEDTEFCLALIKKDFRIRYEPAAVVEHHRRPSLKKHFIQLANYGLHRGYFAKRFPETSLRLQYFIPPLFVIFGTLLVAGTLWGCATCRLLLLILAPLYILLVLISLAGKPLKLLMPTLGMVFLSHMVYGISMIRGLMAAKLPEEK